MEDQTTGEGDHSAITTLQVPAATSSSSPSPSSSQFDDGGAWDDASDPLSDPEEQRVLLSTLDSFRQYRRQSHYNTTHRRRQNLYALPPRHLKLLNAPPFSLLDRLSAIDDAIDSNADIADAIYARGLASFNISSNGGPSSWHNTAQADHHSKAHSTIRQFYRDWTAAGFAAEVKPVLDTIIRALRRHTDVVVRDVLLPGAGLGRLLFELTRAGYNTTGNEISYHQLLASDLILNGVRAANAYTLYPFAPTFTNNPTAAHQLRAYTLPDVHAATALADAAAGARAGLARAPGRMAMAAGDFTTAFGPGRSDAAAFDAVVTVYFIDTAPNLLRYIETIRHCLRPGGVWVNVGPLLWHFDGASSNQHPRGKSKRANGTSSATRTSNDDDDDRGIGQPGGFELADDQVKELVRTMGFDVADHPQDGDEAALLAASGAGGYIQDPDSMLQSRYRPSFWVATKLSQ